MHAYLVTGPSPEKRQREVARLLGNYALKPTNLLTFTASPSHGINTIREITRLLSLKAAPEEYRGILIEDAHLMTQEAQNAFLKTLEEPPRNTILALSAPRTDMLLPTIVSRCIEIATEQVLPKFDEEKEERLFKKLKEAAIWEKIKFTEELGKSREEAIKFIEGQLAFLHQALHASTPEVPILKALLSAHQDLSNNVNPKMVLFELLLKYN